MLDNIKNGQKSACETEKLAETIETKVDQVTSQIHHLEERCETKENSDEASLGKKIQFKKIKSYL